MLPSCRKVLQVSTRWSPHFIEGETEAHREEPQGQTESEGGIRGGHGGWTVIVSPLMLGVERRERMVVCICVCVHGGCVHAQMCVQHGGMCVCVCVCVCTQGSNMHPCVCTWVSVCARHTHRGRL